MVDRTTKAATIAGRQSSRWGRGLVSTKNEVFSPQANATVSLHECQHCGEISASPETSAAPARSGLGDTARDCDCHRNSRMPTSLGPASEAEGARVATTSNVVSVAGEPPNVKLAHAADAGCGQPHPTSGNRHLALAQEVTKGKLEVTKRLYSQDFTRTRARARAEWDGSPPVRRPARATHPGTRTSWLEEAEELGMEDAWRARS